MKICSTRKIFLIKQNIRIWFQQRRMGIVTKVTMLLECARPLDKNLIRGKRVAAWCRKLRSRKKRKINIATGIYSVVVPSGDHKKKRSTTSASVLLEPQKLHYNTRAQHKCRIRNSNHDFFVWKRKWATDLKRGQLSSVSTVAHGKSRKAPIHSHQQLFNDCWTTSVA